MCIVALQALCICVYALGWFVSFYIVARERHATSIKYILYVGCTGIAVGSVIILLFNYDCPMAYVKWGAALSGVLFCLLVLEFCSYFTI